MPKTKRRSPKEQAGAGGAKRGTKRAARLEKELGKVRAAQSKRAAQLEQLQVRANELAGRLAALRAPAGTVADGAPEAAPGSAPEPAAMAYCMRDKHMVEIADAELVVLRNGRRALAGRCPECGTHVVAIVAGPAPVLNGDGRAVESHPAAEA